MMHKNKEHDQMLDSYLQRVSQYDESATASRLLRHIRSTHAHASTDDAAREVLVRAAGGDLVTFLGALVLHDTAAMSGISSTGEVTPTAEMLSGLNASKRKRTPHKDKEAESSARKRRPLGPLFVQDAEYTPDDERQISGDGDDGAYLPFQARQKAVTDELRCQARGTPGLQQLGSDVTNVIRGFLSAQDDAQLRRVNSQFKTGRVLGDVALTLTNSYKSRQSLTTLLDNFSTRYPGLRRLTAIKFRDDLMKRLLRSGILPSRLQTLNLHDAKSIPNFNLCIALLPSSVQSLRVLGSTFDDGSAIETDATKQVGLDARSEEQQTRAIQSLDLSLNTFPSGGAVLVTRELDNLTSLTSLTVRQNNFVVDSDDDYDSDEVNSCTLLSMDWSNLASTLTSLTFAGNMVNGTLMKKSCYLPNLNTLTSLTSLDLSHNSITDGEVTTLFSSNSNLLGLRSLNLSDNWLSEPLASTVGELISLVLLDLSNNNLSDSNGLEKLTKLTSLNLSGNEFLVMPGLEELTLLTHLDVSNTFGLDTFLDSFSGQLKSLTRLQTLNVGKNNFGKLDSSLILSFTDALRSLTALTSLDVSTNYLGNKGVSKILDALKQRTSLQNLDLSGNSIGGDMYDLEKHVNKLAQLPSLVTLNVSSNEFNDATSTALISGLNGCCTKLAMVDLSDNEGRMKKTRSAAFDVKN
jgi:Leucine-rich repeat (LRR) protein